MERRISMILAELRDGLGRVQEKDDQFVEEIKQLENLVDYLSLKEAVELLSELCEACICLLYSEPTRLLSISYAVFCLKKKITLQYMNSFYLIDREQVCQVFVLTFSYTHILSNETP